MKLTLSYIWAWLTRFTGSQIHRTVLPSVWLKDLDLS